MKYREIKPGQTTAQNKPNVAKFLQAIAGVQGAEFDRIRAELSTGTGSEGGHLVREEMFDEVVRQVGERSAFMEAGARMLVLKEKTLPVPRVASLPEPAWRAEGGNVAQSQPVFEAGELAPKSLACIVPVSRELLADGMEAGELLVDAIATGMAQAVDRAIFKGAGAASNEPLGLKNRIALNPPRETLVTVADWRHMVQRYWYLRGLPWPVQPNAMVMSSDVAALLDWMVPQYNYTGEPVAVPPVLRPLKRLTSPALIPSNPGVEGYYFILGDFSQLLIGWRELIEVRMLTELMAGAGKVAFLVHARVDIELRHPQALSVFSNIQLATS